MYCYSMLYHSIVAPAKMILGRGDAAVGNPRRAQISQLELFELVLPIKLDKQFPVEQFEATVSQSTVPSPLLNNSPSPEGGSEKGDPEKGQLKMT